MGVATPLPCVYHSGVVQESKKMRNSVIRFGLSAILVGVVVYLGWPRTPQAPSQWNPQAVPAPNVPQGVNILPLTTGEVKMGLDALPRADKDPQALKDALTALQHASHADPNDPAAAFGLAWAMQLKHDDAGAESEYRRALGLATEQKAIDVQYFVTHNLGGMLLAQKRWEEATQILWQAASLRREWFDLYNLGLGLMQLGKTKDAQFAFEQALLRKPDDAGIHFQLGLVQLRMGREGRAQVEFSEAARLDPSLKAAIAGATKQ
jgi:Tfp pilus assembly protein PilF